MTPEEIDAREGAFQDEFALLLLKHGHLPNRDEYTDQVDNLWAAFLLDKLVPTMKGYGWVWREVPLVGKAEE